MMTIKGAKYSGLTVLPRHIKYKNAMVITPDDDFQAKYDWLKSSDRDGAMGTASTTNRRTLILSPGTYIITETLEMDTDYVDLVGMVEWSPNVSEVPLSLAAIGYAPAIIRWAGGSGTTLATSTGSPTIIQTAKDIRLINLTVQNEGTAYCSDAGSGDGNNGFYKGDSALLIDIDNNGETDSNAASIYKNCTFICGAAYAGGNSGYMTTSGVCGTCNTYIDGTWWFCKGLNIMWRVGHGGKTWGKFYYCCASDASYHGDVDSTTVEGAYYYRCLGRDNCYAGCSAAGARIDSTTEFWFCEGRDRCYGVGRLVEASFYYCIGRDSCFGGTRHDAAGNYRLNSGRFDGYAVGCIAEGNSFGSQGFLYPIYDSTDSLQTGRMGGTLENCVVTNIEAPIVIDFGGRVIGGRYEAQTSSNASCFAVSDADCEFVGVYIKADGTGKPINATLRTRLTQYYAAEDDFVSGSAVGGMVTPYIPHCKAGSLTISWSDVTAGTYNKTVTDDGAGNLTGDVNGAGTNTINYTTGAIDVKLSDNKVAGDYPIIEYTIETDAIVMNCVLNSAISADLTNKAGGSDAGNGSRIMP